MRYEKKRKKEKSILLYTFATNKAQGPYALVVCITWPYVLPELELVQPRHHCTFSKLNSHMLLVRILRYVKGNECSPTPLLILVSI
jgi:hypothetical protein